MTRDQLGAWILIAIALATPTALIIRTILRDTFANAQGVIDNAPYVITDPAAYAAAKTRHPSQVRTYCGTCGHEDCTCGTGVGDQVEAWLAGRIVRPAPDRPYDHEKDGL